MPVFPQIGYRGAESVSDSEAAAVTDGEEHIARWALYQACGLPPARLRNGNWTMRTSQTTKSRRYKQFFAAAEGTLNDFTFVDPTDNLIAQSDHLDNVVWQAGSVHLDDERDCRSRWRDKGLASDQLRAERSGNSSDAVRAVRLPVLLQRVRAFAGRDDRDDAAGGPAIQQPDHKRVDTDRVRSQRETPVVLPSAFGLELPAGQSRWTSTGCKWSRRPARRSTNRAGRAAFMKVRVARRSAYDYDYGRQLSFVHSEHHSCKPSLS